MANNLANVREHVGEGSITELVTKIAADSVALLQQGSAIANTQAALLGQAARVAGNLAADCGTSIQSLTSGCDLTSDSNRDRLAAAGYPARVVDVLRANQGLPVKTLQPISASLLNLVNDGHGTSIPQQC